MIRRVGLARLTDERGVALPLAMIALALLTSLMIAFAVLAKSEPIIANNQHRVAQARSLADSGIERVIWALNATSLNGGIDAPPATLVAAAPYDGAEMFTLGPTGSFTVRVTGVGANEVTVDSNGWHPDPNATARGHRHVTANVTRITPIWDLLPCALCVRGELNVGGGALIDGRTSLALGNNSCGPKLGSASYQHPDAVTGQLIGGTTSPPQGAASIWGAPDGNNVANQASDYSQQLNPAGFDAGMFTDSDINLLRTLAKKNGTYFGPGYTRVDNTGTAVYDPTSTWDGRITFSSSNQVKNGILFIDTVSGNNIPLDQSQQNPNDFADAGVTGNFWMTQITDSFRGWIFVNGKLTIEGQVKIKGLVYAMNDIVHYSGTGNGEIDGQLVSRNIRDTDSTQIGIGTDVAVEGNSTIRFDCNAVRNPPGLSIVWSMKPGSYREVSD